MKNKTKQKIIRNIVAAYFKDKDLKVIENSNKGGYRYHLVIDGGMFNRKLIGGIIKEYGGYELAWGPSANRLLFNILHSTLNIRTRSFRKELHFKQMVEFINNRYVLRYFSKRTGYRFVKIY